MRLGFNIALVVSMLFLPWYVTAILIVAGCFAVKRFYEAVVYGIAFDALYASSWGWHGFPYAFSVGSAAAFVLSLLLRDKLSWD